VDHGKFLLCHLCGHRRIKQIDCEECKASNTLIPCGPGVNRLQEEVTEHYPQATSIIISSDTLKSPKAIQEMVTKVKRKEVEILIGTQMIAKGHDFSNLTVVGIIDADLSLGGGDPRAAEKTFQLLSQVSGRAGRGEKKGAVYVQTYQPHHPVIEAFLNNKRSDFLQWEKETRKTVGLPPFGKLAALILSGKDRLLVEKTARMLVQKAPFYKNIQLWGPAPAPLSFVRSRYRWRLLIKTTILPLKESPSLQDYIDSWLKQCSLPSTVKVSIDIDPYSFL
jgi:primosomal protein N' (replication factor Y)